MDAFLSIDIHGVFDCRIKYVFPGVVDRQTPGILILLASERVLSNRMPNLNALLIIREFLNRLLDSRYDIVVDPGRFVFIVVSLTVRLLTDCIDDYAVKLLVRRIAEGFHVFF